MQLAVARPITRAAILVQTLQQGRKLIEKFQASSERAYTPGLWTVKQIFCILNDEQKNRSNFGELSKGY